MDHQSFGDLNELAESHRALQAAIETGDVEQIRHELAGHIHSQVPEPAPDAASDALQAS